MMPNHQDDVSPRAPTSLARKEALQAEMTLKGHEDWVRDVAFIPGTRLLVTCSDDRSLRVWNLDTGKQVGEPLVGHNEYVLRVTVSSDGRWIVSGARDGSILIWEVPTRKSGVPVLLHSFKGHKSDVWSVVFAPDSETFASASYDKTVCVWRRETSEIALGPFQMGSEAYSVSYSPDGSKLAAGTDKHIVIWNAMNGEELLKIEQRAWRVVFTVDGLRLVSGNFDDVRISDATTGEIIKQFDVHTDLLQSLAIAPDGTKFATTSSDKMTRFFDLTTLEPIGEPLEHPDALYCATFSEDSQLIATGCVDKLVRTWIVDQSESEVLQQASSYLQADYRSSKKDRRPERTGLPRGFFDNVKLHVTADSIPVLLCSQFDTRRPNTRTVPTTSQRDVEGSRMKQLMNHLFSIADVFATRGKYRTANAISGKRHLVQPPRPPRRNARTSNTGVSDADTSAAGTSNIISSATSASMQTTTTSVPAETFQQSPLDAELVLETNCLVILARWLLCVSRAEKTSPTPASVTSRLR
ncbi:WD40-repeat-containing domain protein [Suillus paluster]|uniref:WD40-repeat-containing domain protein n=1 Tax=Suillus paluster TaxID=48578 RepID=UPI001B86F8E9|nr:WD40-repeat-containing domain protein [Suillus paluster]KAG1721232.1 WD40-repeat-containing domain protein [Suillus paluster]